MEGVTAVFHQPKKGHRRASTRLLCEVQSQGTAGDNHKLQQSTRRRSSQKELGRIGRRFP